MKAIVKDVTTSVDMFFASFRTPRGTIISPQFLDNLSQ